MFRSTSAAIAEQPKTVHLTSDTETEPEDKHNDDGLDIISATRQDLSLSSFLPEPQSFDSDSSNPNDAHVSGLGSGKKRKWTRMRDHDIRGERVEWSSSGDEDDLQAFATGQSRKRAARTKDTSAPARKELKTRAVNRRQAKPSTIVGRQVTTRRRKVREWRNDIMSSADSDQDLPEEHLPPHLHERRKAFDATRARLGEAGLKLPPDYSEICFSDNDRLGELRERPTLPHMEPCAPYQDIMIETSGGVIPASIAQWLRPYQVEGVVFLHEKFVYQQGGILGDDMGLGKTIQVIAFLTAAFGKTGDERDRKRMRKVRRAATEQWYPRVLIVCPKGLLDNWLSELQRWGWWQAYVFHGGEEARQNALQAARSGRLEVMLTTYDTYRRQASAINALDWDCVIADECHIIKGKHAEVTKAMNDVNALCRLGLTGTAIQNNYDELWVLLNWTSPGQLGNLASWRKCISEPLRLGQAYDCTTHQLGTARKTAKTLVQKLLPRYFLRRMKSLIAAQLPRKKDRVVFCPLTETQADAYANLVDGDTIAHIRRLGEPCECGSGSKYGWCCGRFLEDGSTWQAHVFPSIAVLQKLANHLAMLIPAADTDDDRQGKDLEHLQTAMPRRWKELYRERDSILHYANVEFCGKWKVMRDLLRFWYDNPTPEGRNKVLVFSHSVRLLRMLNLLFTTTTAYNVSYLDGSMSTDERSAALSAFNTDENQFVFLISTKAGGVGLNITSANKVIVFDPNWNPSFDLQAQDRAYRIGQRRDVDVFRLVSAGTIEEIVYARQIYKQQQANIGYSASSERRYFTGVQDQSDKKGEIFGLGNLFAYNGDNVVLREIVNRSSVAESKAGILVADITGSLGEDDEDGGTARGLDMLKTDGEYAQDQAMKSLAALITAGKGDGGDDHDDDDDKKLRGRTKAPREDPVQAILSRAGVSYTHENSEVIGTSTVESRLSRRAVERENDVDALGETVFDTASQAYRLAGRHRAVADLPPSSPPPAGGVGASPRRGGGYASVRDVRWKYKPPADVLRRQFCSMARHFGFADVVEFALVVEGWTQSQRRACLDRFYRHRRAVLFPDEFADAPGRVDAVGNDVDESSSDEL